MQDQLSVLTGARQTMLAWSKVIETYDEVPAVYKGFFDSQLKNGKEFPYVVFAPALAGPIHKSGEKLICEMDETIYLLEKDGNQFVVTGYSPKNIRDIESGSILLSSWLTINGIATDGRSTSSIVVFNTATTSRYKRIFDKIRPAVIGADAAGLNFEKEKFDYLSTQNFKFMNYARSSLVSGEKVISILLQPEIRGQARMFFGTPIRPAHLTILTDMELILITDGESKGKTKTRKPEYGGIWRYIPLRSIVSVSQAETADGLITLSLQLSLGGQIDRIFSGSQKNELEQLRQKIEALSTCLV
jgi:hypothetical protein